MKRYLKPVRTIVFMGLGRGLVILASLVTIRLVTSLMKPAQYGAISQTISLASLGLALLVTPVIMYLIRRQMEWADTGDLVAALAKVLRILVTIALLVGVAGIAVQLLFPALTIQKFSP